MGKEHFSADVSNRIAKIMAMTERINDHPGKSPTIEIELVLEEIRHLYDIFLSMLMIPASAGVVEERVLAKENMPTAKEDDTREEEIPAEVEEEYVDEPVEEVPEPKETVLPLVEVPSMPEVPSKPAKGKVVKRPEEKRDDDDPEGSKTILAEKLKHGETKSINDIMAERRSDVSLSARIQQHPIHDLRSAIGINEKFIFVYELFAGNVPLYNEAIERLNSMSGRNEAIGLMEEYRVQYHWDIENMAFQKLVDMISRRYSQADSI